MFFLGGLPALVAIYVRSQVKESEVWERTRGQHATFGAYMRQVASHWKLFLYLFVLMTMMNFVSHGTQDMYPTFLKSDWHFSPERIGLISAIANVGAIVGGIIFGHFSDRTTRRRAIISALLLALVAIPLWAFSPTAGLLMVGGFIMQFMVQGAWGVIPVHINELAPDSVRGFLPGFAYQCGSAVAGTVAYIEAVFHDRMSYANAMAFTAATVFTLAAVAAWAGRERHGVAFGE
jgi:SHS family lactate transporter-like MFS transporter